ncbi:MAG: hypothetical protein QM489_04765 [Candidatus Izemoplasma sp.]
MSKCKLCNKEIEDELTFKTIFSKEVKLHKDCELKLSNNSDYEVIPTSFGHLNYISKYKITNNSFDEYFESISFDYYRELFTNSNDYDMYLIIDINLLSIIDEDEMVLIKALSKTKLLLVSLFYINLFEFENLFH